MFDDYCRVITPENLLTEESEEVCAMLVECLELRRKWLFKPQFTPEQRRVGWIFWPTIVSRSIISIRV